jgi:hypothetical protein
MRVIQYVSYHREFFKDYFECYWAIEALQGTDRDFFFLEFVSWIYSPRGQHFEAKRIFVFVSNSLTLIGSGGGKYDFQNFERK